MNHCKDCRWWAPNNEPKESEPERNCRRLKIETDDLFGCNDFMGPNTTEVNVPQHTTNGIEMPPDNLPIPGSVHILIVTYAKDLPWLVQCLRAISVHCSGFSGVTVVYPVHSHELFKTQLKHFDVHLRTFSEIPGKGMLHHMAMMGMADMFVPSGTQFVLHMDSDCIFKMATSPSHYFTAGLPQYLFRSYASMIEEDPTRPGSKVISDCFQWKEPTEAQLGFKVDHAYTMTRHPTVLPIDFYRLYRSHIEKVHGVPFEDYMTDGKNDFPQSKMDFTAMGAFAFYRMKARFRWIDIMSEPYPKDRMKAFWSHGGITQQVRDEIESYLH